MAEDKNTSQVNMKIPGMKGGPRNRGAVVEKPVNSKETFTFASSWGFYQ